MGLSRKRKLLYSIFVVEALICTILAIVNFAPNESVFVLALSFPFSQIGSALRALSLAGGFANVAAIIIYVLFCILPAGFAAFKAFKKNFKLEDIALLLLSGLLFYIIYLMINPALIPALQIIIDAVYLQKAILGIAFYSVLFAYLILKLMRYFTSSKTRQLQKFMVALLLSVNAYFVFVVFGIGVSGLLQALTSITESNKGNENLLGVTYLFLGLEFLVKNIPNLFSIFIVFAAISLLKCILQSQYTEESVKHANILTKLCKLSLVLTASSLAVFNVLQLVFASKIYDINSSFNIPLFSVLLTLTALLMARFVAQAKILKDDNDSFI